MKTIRKQQGVALITALFIFALVTIAAVAMADRQALDIRRTENLLHYDQAYMFTLGLEKAAAVTLIELDQDKNVDHLGELFLTTPVVEEVEGGTVQGSIRDVSGRFPLNNLVDANGNRNEAYVNAFQRFVDYMMSGDKCGGQSSFNPEFAYVVLDWIDANDQAEVGGAEDLVYLNRERRPHRTANQMMASITELRALNNLIAEEYNCMVGGGTSAPLVNAIRVNDVPINVNTAPPEVIQSLHPQIDDTILAALVEGREEEPYTEIGKFVEKLRSQLDLDGQGQTPEEQQARAAFTEHMGKLHLDVKSQYFEVNAIAQIGRMQVTLIALLKRDGNKVTTVERHLGIL